ncbi:MAG: hypothetical protein AAF488_19575, partial [Planctomycetota bacterium]
VPQAGITRCSDTGVGVTPVQESLIAMEESVGHVVPGLIADIAEASKLRTGFTLDQPAERLEIAGFYEKVGVAFGVSLRGRLTQVFPAGGIDDEFTFPDPLLGDAKRWHALTYYRADSDVGSDPSASICFDGNGAPKLIPAGDYVLEIYAVGGEIGTPYYQFADDPRDVELLIEGTPCPPYPLVRVRDVSGFRTLPNVTGLKNEDAYELPSGKVRATFSARGTWFDEAGNEWSIDPFCDQFVPVGIGSSTGPSPVTNFVCDDPEQKTSPFHEYCWVIHAFEPPMCVVNRGSAGAITQLTLPDWGCYKVELTVTDVACGTSRTFIDEIAVTPNTTDDCQGFLYSFLYPTPDPGSIEVVVGLESPTPGFGEFDGDRPLDMRILVAPSCFCTGLDPCVSPILDADPLSGGEDSFELRLAVFDGSDYHDLGATIEVYDLCPDVVEGAKYFQVRIENMTEIAASPHLVGHEFRDVYLQGRTLCYQTETGCFVPVIFPWINAGPPMRMSNPPDALYDSHWCGFYDEEAGAYRFSVTPTGDSEVFHALASSPSIPFGIADAGLPEFEGNAIGSGFISRFETQG